MNYKSKYQAQAIYTIIQFDIKKHEYSRMQALHEMVDPDYKLLMNKRRDKERPAWGAIGSIIFYDVVDVIVDGLERDKSLRHIFISLYEPIVPKYQKVIDCIKKATSFQQVEVIFRNLEDDMLTYHFVMYCLSEMEEYNDFPLWYIEDNTLRPNHQVYCNGMRVYQTV